MNEWQQPSGGPQGFGPPPVSTPDNQMALFSLIAGIASWVMFPMIGAIVAVVCGHIARKEIRESGGRQGGDGMAIGGLVLGYVHLAFNCVIIGFIVMMFAGVFAAVGLGAAAQP